MNAVNNLSTFPEQQYRYREVKEKKNIVIMPCSKMAIEGATFI